MNTCIAIVSVIRGSWMEVYVFIKLWYCDGSEGIGCVFVPFRA